MTGTADVISFDLAKLPLAKDFRDGIVRIVECFSILLQKVI